MRTLLVNAKMNPALAARIEASLQRRSGHADRGIYRPRTVAVARALGVLAVLAVIAAIWVTQRRARVRFETRRDTLVHDVEARSASLTDGEKGMVARAEPMLRALAGPWEGDFVAPELRVSGLAPILAAPMAYVHGLHNDFTADRSIAVASQETGRDAFLYCTFDPPAARDEATLIAKVREVWKPELMEQRTGQVALFGDAEAAFPFLLPSFLARANGAKTGLELGQLEQAFAHAPIDGAKKAARARHLLAVLDEGFGPRLDGDHAHDVRVGIFDVVSSNVVLRLRRRVDPAIISAPSRPRFSIDADACVLAMDVRDALQSPGK